ncbi:peptide/nickel transport system substrate-binding protein [Microbacterium terrae]|nr:ABC transporter substrate-binding protein [Microbacterium terrae]MBP1076376.1 peptide/nickel transport system substrate-binding protein [Microbacterium terrae]
MTRRGARIAALLTGAALAVSLTACAADDSVTGEEGSETHDLIVGAMGGPASLDPAMLYEGQSAYVWSAVYDTLLAKNPETGEIEGNAAESWEYSEDGLTLTLKIREGMTFSSGDPVDAEAVAASMNRTRTTPGTQQSRFAMVSDVVAVDDSTVEVQFTEFDPAFLETLFNATGVIGDPATVEDEATATDPVGSGPYTLSDETVAGTAYVLEKRDEYWNADAFPFDTITVKVFADPTAQINALQAGEIYAATVNPQMIAPFEADAETFSFQTVTGATIAELVILDRTGERIPALGDERVRQAINMAIDREGMVSSLMPDTGAATNQLFGPTGNAYIEELDSYFDYDVEAAKELMADAGYADGFTLPIPSTYLSTRFEPLLSDQLSEIGITVEWVPTPPNEMDGINFSGKYGATIAFGSFTGGDPGILEQNFGSGQNNPSGYTDDVIDAAMEEIHGSIDQDAAAEAYRTLNQHVVEIGLTAPFARIDTIWVLRDGVAYLDSGASTMNEIRVFGLAESD